LLLIIACILIFTNLDGQYLCQDEGKTAVLAERVMEFGYPKVYDGKNLVDPAVNSGYSKDRGWRDYPWIPFYVTAVSFKIFGSNAWSARFPFAATGVVSICLLYLLARQVFNDSLAAVISSVLIVLSVPYILMMRQCGHYALVSALVLFIFIFYRRFVERPGWGAAVLCSGALVLLAYSMHVIFISIFVALGFHFLVFCRKKECIVPVVFCASAVLLAALPWFLYSHGAWYAAPVTRGKIMSNIKSDVEMMNKYVFPVFFFGVVYIVRGMWKRKWSLSVLDGERNYLVLLCTVILVSVATLAVSDEMNFSHLAFLLPLLAIAEAMILVRTFRWNSSVFYSFMILSVLTGVFNVGHPTFCFPKYLYDMTYEHDGPRKEVVKFLKKNAMPSDMVKMNHEDASVMFYTGLKVDNSGIYDDAHMPEWIVFRHDCGESLDSPYYQKVQAVYNRYDVDYADIKWANMSDDMVYNKLWTDESDPGVIIFGKRKI